MPIKTHTTDARDTYSVALLIKADDAQNISALHTYYLKALQEKDIDTGDIVIIELPYNPDNPSKVTVKIMKAFLDELLLDAESLGIQHIVCCDGNYFKQLTKQKSAEAHLGYVLDCAYVHSETKDTYESLSVMYAPNYRSIVYNSANEPKLVRALNAVSDHLEGKANVYTSSVVKRSNYITGRDEISVKRIKKVLKALLDQPVLACDIEAFSLKHYDAGLGTIGFAINKHEGVAFNVDVHVNDDGTTSKVFNTKVRKLLRGFFDTYTGKLLFHNAAYDIKVLIYQLYMTDIVDIAGLVSGWRVLTNNYDDTKVMAYLCCNSTAQYSTSLKNQAQEFAGNYGQGDDIKNILNIPNDELLEYNLTDCCATYWLYEKYSLQLIADEQTALYHQLFLPSQSTIIRTELTGIPIDMNEVSKAKAELTEITEYNMYHISVDPHVLATEKALRKRKWEKDYADRKAKAKNPDKIQPKDFDTFPEVEFNPNSRDHLKYLLIVCLQLPQLETTKTGEYATGADVLKALKSHCKPDDIELLNSLIDYTKAQKILSTFISAFEEAVLAPDGHHYLFGSFNLGGTVSGRLSSSNPNLQNLPSGSVFGKLIKRCVVAPPGHVWAGADFASLEAMINALTTKDPNKLTVYENGLDSHSWNAFGYWPDKFPDIARRVELSKKEGKFYKQQQPDGSYKYYHESELS